MLPLGLMKGFALMLATGVLALAVPARAAGVGDEFAGVRSYAMGGAHRGVGTSNDTIYLNPAGMAMVKRYAVGIEYAYSPYDDLRHLNFSAVDSKSGPVAGGFAYTRDSGGKDGLDVGLHRFYLAAAYPISEALAFGMTLRHVRGDIIRAESAERVRAYTGDIGIMAALAEGLMLGFSYSNVVETDVPELTPARLGFGVGYSNPMFTLAADVTIGVGDNDEGVAYYAGAEYLLGERFPLRLGYRRTEASAGGAAIENHLTAGLGWLSRSGGVEVGYRRSIDRRDDFGIVGALKFFF